jgi:hypothetical protein
MPKQEKSCGDSGIKKGFEVLSVDRPNSFLVK